MTNAEIIKGLKAVRTIHNGNYAPFIDEAIKELEKQMPQAPVTPQPKLGHWKWVKYANYSILGDWVCSECKSVAVEAVRKDNKGGIPLYKYCPECGIKMEEIKEGK